MGAVRQVLPSVIKDVLREIYPGEQIGIKLSIPKTNPVAKAACVARILQLKDEGKSHSEISKIVKVSKSTVFNVVARRRSSLVG
jgi:Mor family transcriptional regulator